MSAIHLCTFIITLNCSNFQYHPSVYCGGIENLHFSAADLFAICSSSWQIIVAHLLLHLNVPSFISLDLLVDYLIFII